MEPTTIKHSAKPPPPATSPNTAEKLLAASGLHFITANLQQVLSDSFKNSFEITILSLYKSYRQQLPLQQSRYESLLSIKTKAIQDMKIRNMTQGGSRHARNTPRNLDSFCRGLKAGQTRWVVWLRRRAGPGAITLPRCCCCCHRECQMFVDEYHFGQLCQWRGPEVLPGVEAHGSRNWVGGAAWDSGL
ncbi:hypothetical protein PCASD_24661 [Puccinia coronata f. sp. avenae]|uniref:Uncharacterized protein n=1 Tax=Puccinia coronata f. sp. avenae TaxID=200324 RepID=A0A2N5TMA3_9BASI|nr:hypothetical protein PCASD_24661 [Puccinia coronata f. sp. avenae]